MEISNGKLNFTKVCLNSALNDEYGDAFLNLIQEIAMFRKDFSWMHESINRWEQEIKKMEEEKRRKTFTLKIASDYQSIKFFR